MEFTTHTQDPERLFFILVLEISIWETLGTGTPCVVISCCQKMEGSIP
jgi:hypothetical protein